MLEFEINMSEMPLGKLSKANIQKGTPINLLYTNYIIYFWEKNLLYHCVIL